MKTTKRKVQTKTATVGYQPLAKSGRVRTDCREKEVGNSRAIGYVRHSMKGSKADVRRQLESCAQYFAPLQDRDVIFSDPRESRVPVRLSDRPALQRLLRRGRDEGSDVLVVECFDRLCRGTPEDGSDGNSSS